MPLTLASLTKTDPAQVNVVAQIDAGPNSAVRLALVGCASGQARVVVGGTYHEIELRTQFTVPIPASGTVSFWVFPNDLIACGGILGATQWQVDYVENGLPTRNPEMFSVLSTINPFSLTTNMPAPAPLGTAAPTPGGSTLPNADASDEFLASTAAGGNYTARKLTKSDLPTLASTDLSDGSYLAATNKSNFFPQPQTFREVDATALTVNGSPIQPPGGYGTVTVNDDGSVTFDGSTGTYFSFNLTQDVPAVYFANLQPGVVYVFGVNSFAGSFQFPWPSSMVNAQPVAPHMRSTLTAVCNFGSNLFCLGPITYNS